MPLTTSYMTKSRQTTAITLSIFALTLVLASPAHADETRDRDYSRADRVREDRRTTRDDRNNDIQVSSSDEEGTANIDINYGNQNSQSNNNSTTEPAKVDIKVEGDNADVRSSNSSTSQTSHTTTTSDGTQTTRTRTSTRESKRTTYNNTTQETTTTSSNNSPSHTINDLLSGLFGFFGF